MTTAHPGGGCGGAARAAPAGAIADNPAAAARVSANRRTEHPSSFARLEKPCGDSNKGRGPPSRGPPDLKTSKLRPFRPTQPSLMQLWALDLRQFQPLAYRPPTLRGARDGWFTDPSSMSGPAQLPLNASTWYVLGAANWLVRLASLRGADSSGLTDTAARGRGEEQDLGLLLLARSSTRARGAPAHGKQEWRPVCVSLPLSGQGAVPPME